MFVSLAMLKWVVREVLATLEDWPSAVQGAVLARDRTLPLVASLADIFPDSGLRRGSTVVVGSGPVPGTTSLALALLSGPSAGGSWCAVVGAPDLGLVAAAQLGIDLERLAVVPSPGAKWAVVTAALLEGFDLVLLCPSEPVSHSDARKLEARARERGSVLAVLGEVWPGTANIHLGVVAGSWRGLEDGCGYLAGRQVEVVTAGRGAASRPRRTRLWLGGLPFGSIAGQAPDGLPKVLRSEAVPEELAEMVLSEVLDDEVAVGADLAG
jgi:hypothetical protein